MKNTLKLFGILVVAVNSLWSGEEVRLRYRTFSGPVTLTMSQEIHTAENDKRVAGRQFDLGLSVRPGESSREAVLTVDEVSATYEAHGMESRLGTRAVRGRSFPLAIAGDGLRVEEESSSDDPAIVLDSGAPSGFTVSGLLSQALPQLPDPPVSVGTKWETRRQVRTLEGWGWATGEMTSVHQITGVETSGSQLLVSVDTRSQAKLGPEGDQEPYTGNLTRTLKWRFNAGSGQLISLKLDQEAESVVSLPQGKIPIRQVTRLELGFGS